MLSYVYEKTSRPSQAIEILRKTLELDKENINALNSLGYLLVMHGNDEEKKKSLSYIIAALKKEPLQASYLDSLGTYYYEMEDYERAFQALGKALRIAPEEPEILEHMRNLIQKIKEKE